jgi:hypothetical protein
MYAANRSDIQEVIIMNIRSVTPLIIFLLLPIAQSSAGQVYTWVDENGTTHFSEAPPDNEAISTEQINLQPAPSAGIIAGDDFYSVANQADRMERTRLENEKLTAERLQAEAEANRARAEARATQQIQYQGSSQDDARYYPAYSYYPNYRHRPGHGNKPHPGKPGRPGHLPAGRPMSSLSNRSR